MSNDKEASPQARKRRLAHERRQAAAKRRNDLFDLMISGFSHARIAEQFNMTPAAVRRTIDRQIAMRRLEAPDAYIHVQVARLDQALQGLDPRITRGDVHAVDRLVKIVAQLDRYHGLAAPPALRPLAPGRLGQDRRGALSAPPRALTHQPEAGQMESVGDLSGAASQDPESGQK